MISENLIKIFLLLYLKVNPQQVFEEKLTRASHSRIHIYYKLPFYFTQP